MNKFNKIGSFTNLDLIRYYKILTVSFLLSYSSLLVAGDNLNIEVNPRKITVGDPIDMVMSVKVPKGAKVVFPTQENFRPAEILKIDTLTAKDDRLSVRYTISLYEPGKQELSDLPILLLAGGETETLWVDPGYIEVKSILEERADTSLRDVKPPIKMKWRLSDVAPYIVITLALIVMAILGYIIWRRYKHKKGEIPVYTPPPLPPHIIALRKLEELRIKKLWQNGFIKEFHSELTEIIKEYIEKRYGFSALEMTSAEIFELRKIWAPQDDLFIPMRRMMTCADLVKFAKFKPEPQENERSLNVAFTYVEATKEDESLTSQTTTAEVKEASTAQNPTQMTSNGEVRV